MMCIQKYILKGHLYLSNFCIYRVPYTHFIKNETLVAISLTHCATVIPVTCIVWHGNNDFPDIAAVNYLDNSILSNPNF